MRLHAVQGLKKPSTELTFHDLDQSDLDTILEPEKMNLLKRIKRGIEFLGDWFSDQPDDYLITEYGFLKTFVEWD